LDVVDHVADVDLMFGHGFPSSVCATVSATSKLVQSSQKRLDG
jgi:hypothetical protein